MNYQNDSDLHTVVYVSSAAYEFATKELEELLTEARALNRESGVTGVLLYSDGNFMQLFEGERTAVDDTYGRIRSSRRHTGIIQLLDEKIGRRSFPEWQMGFARPTTSQMLELSTARWSRMRTKASYLSPKPEGLNFLEHFWKLSQQH